MKGCKMKPTISYKIIDEIRYFPARTGVMMRDQIIKILVESDVPRSAYGYERLLKCISNGLRTYRRYFKTRINDQMLNLSSWFKTVLAVKQDRAVGLIFVERDDMYIWVDSGFRRKKIGTRLFYVLAESYPEDFKYNLLRPRIFNFEEAEKECFHQEIQFWNTVFDI